MRENTFGAKLKAIRKQARESQDDLARVLGVARNTISTWETGRSYPELESFNKILNHYDVEANAMASEAELYRILMYGGPGAVETDVINLTVSTTDPQLDRITELCRRMNAQGMQKIIEYAEDICDNPKYLK